MISLLMVCVASKQGWLAFEEVLDAGLGQRDYEDATGVWDVHVAVWMLGWEMTDTDRKVTTPSFEINVHFGLGAISNSPFQFDLQALQHRITFEVSFAKSHTPPAPAI